MIDSLIKNHLFFSVSVLYSNIFTIQWGWLGEANVSCILCHQGIQLLLVYSWARPAILAEGKGRRGMFSFPLFLHFHSFPLSHLCLSFIFSTISSIFSLSLGGNTKWPTRVDVSLKPDTVNYHTVNFSAKNGPDLCNFLCTTMWILYLKTHQQSGLEKSWIGPPPSSRLPKLPGLSLPSKNVVR